jgi:predicted nucleic acid-binding Zn ribbon protein
MEEARCMVCGNPLGHDIFIAGVEGLDVCSEECANIYYRDEDNENNDE